MGEAKRRKAATESRDNSLRAIRSLLEKLTSGRQEYDFQPPALASHAANYANQPARLRRYAEQVINGRIMILLASSTVNTQVLLRTYLLGVDTKNPFPMLFAGRCQLELFALVADTTLIIKVIPDNIQPCPLPTEYKRSTKRS